ncbi:unnamed protein product [Alternaria alternata]
MAKLNILRSSTKIYNEQTHGLSAYFRGTFSNFNPDVVDLNKVDITYEYGDHYFVLVQLPHPQTSELIFRCGFLNRAYVGPYLVYEWNSRVKEQIGEWGAAVYDDDGRINKTTEIVLPIFYLTMDTRSYRQSPELNPPKELRRWNYDEENRLLYLIKVEEKTYKEAATSLNRSIQSVQHRYSIIRQRDESASISWTTELDSAIIDGRRRGLTPNEIAQEINIPEKAIQSRWQALRAAKKVPEDVLDLRRRKPLRDFTPQEDETILNLYVEGHDDKDIATKVWMDEVDKDDGSALD